MPVGEIQITAHRLGYKTKSLSFEHQNPESSTELEILLTATLLSSQSIEITADASVNGAHLIDVSEKIYGDDLRQEMGATISQTLSNVSGFSQRTMGSTPSRPIIRGLGDERLLILEDGINSGDVSDQSPDHSVTVESSTAQEIEIARGPTALAYGANAVGGIVNIVSNKISSTVPQNISGSFSISGETVNTGGSTSAFLSLPLDNIVINTNIAGRTNLDTTTPIGNIKNTYSNTFSTSLGMSYIKDWGFIGASFSYYDSDFGIPPDPAGHPDGVVLDMQKHQYVLKAEYIIDTDFLKVWETDFSINNYHHIEFEAIDLVGMEFGLVTTNIKSKISHGELGLFEKGTFGISLEYEDYAVTGASTPNSNSFSMGAFILEEQDFNNVHLEMGLRIDHVTNAPQKNDPESTIGNIRTRHFTALSSSVSAIYPFTDNIHVGASLLHSFRAPPLEELYSEGPHLAVYTFEIGNPDLEAERGIAKELFLTYNNKNTVLKTAMYHNGFSNFLYAQDTGKKNNKNPELNNYQFVGVEAQLYGFEVSAEQQFFTNFLFKGSVNYTVGQQNVSVSNSNQVPLPLIPPLALKSSIKYARNTFNIGSRLTFNATQNELGEFETPTDSFILIDGFASLRIHSGKLLHTFSVNATNISNVTYRNHLSIIKDLNPEAGRNFSVLYRLYF